MMILYACEKCGKRATAKEKFCSACGGEIKVKEKPPVIEPTEAEASAETEPAATEASAEAEAAATEA